MRREDYQALFELEAEYWWFVGMRAIAAALLNPYLDRLCGSSALDAGCGTGFNLAWLAGLLPRSRVAGIDIAPEALARCRARNQDKLARASVVNLPFRDRSFDLVLSLDVICQLESRAAEVQALAELARVLKRDGLLLVRVPAFNWLYSSHDQQLATYRRYRLRELKELLKRAGFRIERATYANSLLFPLAAAFRIAKRFGLAPGSDVKPLPRWLVPANCLLAALLGAEARLLGKGRRSLPFGLSAICLARRER